MEVEPPVNAAASGPVPPCLRPRRQDHSRPARNRRRRRSASRSAREDHSRRPRCRTSWPRETKRCCGSIATASSGDMLKNSGSNLSMSSRAPSTSNMSCRRLRISIEIVRNGPTIGRDLRNAIAPGGQIAPECAQIRGHGEPARHADDGDVARAPAFRSGGRGLRRFRGSCREGRCRPSADICRASSRIVG